MKGVEGVVGWTDEKRTKNGRAGVTMWGVGIGRIRPSYFGVRTDECINNALEPLVTFIKSLPAYQQIGLSLFRLYLGIKRSDLNSSSPELIKLCMLSRRLSKCQLPTNGSTSSTMLTINNCISRINPTP